MEIKNQNFKIFVFCFIFLIIFLNFSEFVAAQENCAESSVYKENSSSLQEKAMGLWSFISQKASNFLGTAAKFIEPMAPNIKEEFKKELTEMKEDLSGFRSFIWKKAKKWVIPSSSNTN